MQAARRLVSVVCLGVLTAGCGGAPPKPTPAVKSARPEAVLVAAPPPDLSPVQAPPELVARARLTRPSELSKVLGQWMGLPFDPRAIDALEPGFSDAIRFDASWEAAAALPADPARALERPLAVVSVPVTSVPKARELLTRKSQKELLPLGDHGWITDAESSLSCAIAPAVGEASHRIVCGVGREDVDTLLPYATRGLPREDFGAAEASLWVGSDALRSRYQPLFRTWRAVAVPLLMRKLDLDDPRLDKPLASLLHGVGNELDDLFQDVQDSSCRLSHHVEPERFELDCEFGFRSAQSLYAKLLTDTASRQTVPPPLFLDLPEDVTSASFGVASRAELARPLTDRFVDAIEGGLSHLEVNPGLSRELGAALRDLLSADVVTVTAAGEAAPATQTEKKPGANVTRPWGGSDFTLVGLQDRSKRYERILDLLVRLSQDPKFSAGLAELSDAVPTIFTGLDWGKKANGTAPIKLKKKVVRGLAQARGYELQFPSIAPERSESTSVTQGRSKPKTAKDPKRTVDRLSIILLPDGDRTFLAWGFNEDEMVKRLKQCADPSELRKLGGRADLTRLRGTTASAAGFVTLMGFKSSLLAAADSTVERTRIESIIAALPHGGKTPMTWTMTLLPQAKAVRAKASFVLNRDVFDDVAAMLAGIIPSL